MRISGTEPSSVILSQKSMYLQKVKRGVLNVPKQAESKSPQNYNFKQF